MSRLRVRTPSGSWLDVCESEWYVRDAKNLNWIRLVVSKEMKVRHGSNAYWLNIECDVDDIYCPPDEVLECWPGATGNFDNGIIIDGGPTGSQLCDCDGKNCVTYIGPGPGGEGNGNAGPNTGGQLLATSSKAGATGSKTMPLPCPVTAYGGRATITEFYVELSQVSGMVTLNARGITGSVRVRIYKNCELLADTDLAQNATRNGIKSYVTKFMNDTASGIGRVLVRVDAQNENTLWDVALSCPNQDPDFNDIEPAQCYGTFHALIGCTAFVYERMHKLEGSGVTWLDITVGKEPIRVSAFYQGQLLASTVDLITSSTQLSWNFQPRNNDDLVTIRVECDQPTTAWTYSLYCAGTTGSFNNPDHCCGTGLPERCEDIGKPCPPEYNRVSNKADVTDTWYDLSKNIDGKVYIPYNLIGDQPLQILVYQNGSVVAGIGPKLGSGKLVFMFKKANGTKIRVRVIGTCCPQWTFSVLCPFPLPQACIDNPRMVRPLKGQVGQLCFTLTLDHIYDETVTVDYETRSSNAIGVYAQTNVLVEDEFNYPFLAVADSGTGRVVYDAGFPKFYNSVVNAVTDQYLRNVVNYCANPSKPKRALVCSSAQRGNAYPADGQNTGFGIRVPNILAAMGFAVDVACVNDPFFGGIMDHDYDKLAPYSMVIFFSSDEFNAPNITERTATAYGEFVKKGNGLFLVTDHYSFQYAANMIAKQYGVVFSGSVDRQPVSIARSIQIYGPSPLWNGIETQTFSAGGSEGIIGVEYTPPDYVPEKGTVEFSPCETARQVCIDIWGISRPGPDRTVEVVLKSAKNATICTPGVGTGTIENNYVANCPSNTQLVVKDGGAHAVMGSGARLMYTQESLGAANFQYSSILDMKINFPAEGIYRFYVWGDDEAELYLDCDLVVKHVLSSGTTIIQSGPASRPYWVPAGEVYLYLIYTNRGPRSRSASATSMKIMYPNGSPFYVSNAANWRSRVLDMGLPPICKQFPDTCQITPTGGVRNGGNSNSHNIGYPGAQNISSTLHSPNCAPGGTFYVLETMIAFPVTGIYTWVGTADDNIWMYLDCNLFATGNNWEGTFYASVYVTAGMHRVTAMYQNIPNCTPGWVKFVFLAPDLHVTYQSEATGWGSIQGNLSDQGAAAIYSGGSVGAWAINYLGGLGARAISAPFGQNYGYTTSELKFSFPHAGNYSILLFGDDTVEVFVECRSVAYSGAVRNGSLGSGSFYAGAGETNIIVRHYNVSSPQWFIFAILDEGGNVVYGTNTAGWKCRLGDMNFSGIS